jgi:hypothetical protein
MHGYVCLRVYGWGVKGHAIGTGDVFGIQASKNPRMMQVLRDSVPYKLARAIGIGEGRGSTRPFGWVATRRRWCLECLLWAIACAITLAPRVAYVEYWACKTA